jgi:hypothetical protein
MPSNGGMVRLPAANGTDEVAGLLAAGDQAAVVEAHFPHEVGHAFVQVGEIGNVSSDCVEPNSESTWMLAAPIAVVRQQNCLQLVDTRQPPIAMTRKAPVEATARCADGCCDPQLELP